MPRIGTPPQKGPMKVSVFLPKDDPHRKNFSGLLGCGSIGVALCSLLIQKQNETAILQGTLIYFFLGGGKLNTPIVKSNGYDL